LLEPDGKWGRSILGLFTGIGGFHLKSGPDAAKMDEIQAVLLYLDSARMIREQRQFELKEGGSSAANCPSVGRRLFAFIAAVFALALFPRLSQADFIGGLGLCVGDTAAAASVGEGASGNFFEDAMCSSSRAEQKSAAQDGTLKRSKRESVPLCGLANEAGSGCGSSTPTNGGGSGSSVGIVNESSAALHENFAGMIGIYSLLGSPSPITTRLLDPPRDIA
jgi:hypothetical protein